MSLKRKSVFNDSKKNKITVPVASMNCYCCGKKLEHRNNLKVKYKYDKQIGLEKFDDIYDNFLEGTFEHLIELFKIMEEINFGLIEVNEQITEDVLRLKSLFGSIDLVFLDYGFNLTETDKDFLYFNNRTFGKFDCYFEEKKFIPFAVCEKEKKIVEKLFLEEKNKINSNWTIEEKIIGGYPICIGCDIEEHGIIDNPEDEEIIRTSKLLKQNDKKEDFLQKVIKDLDPCYLYGNTEVIFPYDSPKYKIMEEMIKDFDPCYLYDDI